MMLKDRGFSLVEVIIAAGLLSGLGIFLMKINSEQQKTESRSLISFEINSISNMISQTLLSSESCTNTIGGSSKIEDGYNINSIKSRTGSKLFSQGKGYSNNKVLIESIELSDVAIAPAATNKYGTANVKVLFKKNTKTEIGNKEVIKTFPIRVEVNASDELIKCYSSTENAIETATKLSCQSLGGVFDSTIGLCSLKDFNPIQDSKSDAVSHRNLKDYIDNLITTTLDARYINVDGDTMTGSLVVKEKVSSEKEFCVDGRCSYFETASCPNGAIQSIDAKGNHLCIITPKLNVFCASDKIFSGTDSNGDPVCKTLTVKTEPKVVANWSAKLCKKSIDACCPSDYERISCADGWEKGDKCCENVDNTYGPICKKTKILAKVNCLKTTTSYK